jgi:hypothetical protein
MIAMATKYPTGDPMTLGNMRVLGVQRLVAYCLDPSWRHEGLIDVSKYRANIEVP